MTSLSHRLDQHFAAAVAASAAVAAFGDRVEAAIVYSGIVNISIPGNVDGVYLNMVTGVTGTSAASTPGHDFNPYFGGNNLFMSTVLGNNAVGMNGTAVDNVPAGFLISGASPFITSTSFPTMGNLPIGNMGFIALRFRREFDGATLYGWVRMIRSESNSLPGMIVDYAYDDNGNSISVGFVPAPGSLVLLGLSGCFPGRRRRA